MSNRLIDRLMGAVRSSNTDYHSAGSNAKQKADERLVYKSLKADLETDDHDEHLD